MPLPSLCSWSARCYEFEHKVQCAVMQARIHLSLHEKKLFWRYPSGEALRESKHYQGLPAACCPFQLASSYRLESMVCSPVMHWPWALAFQMPGYSQAGPQLLHRALRCSSAARFRLHHHSGGQARPCAGMLLMAHRPTTAPQQLGPAARLL